MSIYFLIGAFVFALAIAIAAVLADWLWDRLEPKPAELDELEAIEHTRPLGNVDPIRKP